MKRTAFACLVAGILAANLSAALHETARRGAQGAALMTDTTMTENVLAGPWPRFFNQPVAEAMQQNIERVGMPAWSPADQALARAAQKHWECPTMVSRRKPAD